MACKTLHALLDNIDLTATTDTCALTDRTGDRNSMVSQNLIEILSLLTL
jgi:hypothetical protein